MIGRLRSRLAGMQITSAWRLIAVTLAVPVALVGVTVPAMAGTQAGAEPAAPSTA